MSMKKHQGHLEGWEYLPIDPSDPNQYFVTKDFPLAVTLICKRFEMATIDKKDGTKSFEFIFEQQAGMGDVIENYWLHRVFVDPLEYENTRKNLKARMYSFIRY